MRLETLTATAPDSPPYSGRLFCGSRYFFIDEFEAWCTLASEGECP